jgi:hypothetical protein
VPVAFRHIVVGDRPPGSTHLILTIFPRRLEKGKGASE